jgi:hypothetical protein
VCGVAALAQEYNKGTTNPLQWRVFLFSLFFLFFFSFSFFKAGTRKNAEYAPLSAAFLEIM